MQDVEERKQAYQKKLEALKRECEKCIKQSNGVINYDRCQMHCRIGFRIRALETEYSDVTGFSHNSWKT